jgi:hypothetical protein
MPGVCKSPAGMYNSRCCRELFFNILTWKGEELSKSPPYSAVKQGYSSRDSFFEDSAGGQRGWGVGTPHPLLFSEI